MQPFPVTPLSQALSEGVLSRADLRDLMQRSNGPALRHMAIWVLVLACTGWLIHVSMGSLWVWPAMFLHGVVLVHHFSLQHECVHYTVFRTRWLNDLAGHICGLIIMLPHTHFRYEHCDHHTYTQLAGDDPELIPLPKTFAEYVLYLTGLPYWRNKFSELFMHVGGRLTEAEKRFVPKVAHKTVIREARLMLVVYLLVIGAMLVFNWSAPLWYWFIPLLLGEPVMRFVRMTEHVGRPTVAAMSDNTRSNPVSLPWRFLCWNMNYHAEHHYAASVPFHALPRLHDKLQGHIFVEKGGYLGAHRDILAQIRGRHGG